MGEVFQEVKFWRWLMNIRTLKVLVFRQFFQKIMARHWERVEVYIQAFRISSKKKFKKPVIPLFLKSAVFDCYCCISDGSKILIRKKWPITSLQGGSLLRCRHGNFFIVDTSHIGTKLLLNCAPAVVL